MSSEVHVDPNDSYGKKIGVLAAILAILLSIFTICAHRAHTETIVLQNEANDQWSYYQAKHIRDYQLEMNLDLLKLLAAKNPNSSRLSEAYSKKHAEYSKELADIKKEAAAKVHESMTSQKKALSFDFAEGVLEIALVMSSLYFISHRKLFPRFGFVFGIAGTLIGVFGFLF